MPLPVAHANDPARHRLGASVETLSRVARVLERASGELSLSHYRVLAMVSAGDGRASRLASRLALGKPAISAAVESLASRGLLERFDSDSDRRASQLQITAQGTEALKAAEAAMCEALDDLLRHAGSAPAILGAIGDIALALERRQAARETRDGHPATVAHPHS